MNFGISDDSALNNEYNLFRSTTEELINLYGIEITYILTVDNEKIFKFFAKPEETETFGGEGDLYSKFGLQNLDTMSFYVSRTDMEKIHPEIVNRAGKATVDNLPFGNIIKLPNNKLLEVTDMKLQSDTFGNNNSFTTDRHKNVYKLVTKSYFYNHDDLEKSADITTSDKFDYTDFGNLDAIFSDENTQRDNVTTRSESTILADETIYPAEIRKKPVRIKTDETNPFGDFG